MPKKLKVKTAGTEEGKQKSAQDLGKTVETEERSRGKKNSTQARGYPRGALRETTRLRLFYKTHTLQSLVRAEKK